MKKKSGSVYAVIISAWLALLWLAFPSFSSVVRQGISRSWWVGGLVMVANIFIAYFWLNGTKDIIYTAYYHRHLRDKLPEVPPRRSSDCPRVVLVYCTYNDFSAESLLRSKQQDYDNFETVICDDSTRQDSKDAIDAFAATHDVTVVRRDDRDGFKAGNLNNYLRSAEFDYFVLLDSDEIVPPHFIDRCLDYFAAYANAGIVQANHVATRNRNDFMSTFSIGVDAHWIAYQSVKDTYGFLSLLGHGAMVSRECYEAAGGFPHVVAEDLCFTIRARDEGFVTVFAPDVVCEEEYPVDYLAFKKRHGKWTQGNMEFIKRYSGVIARSRMTWFEKLDIVLFTYSLPLTFVFSLYVALFVVVFPVADHLVAYPLWMLAPTVCFLLAPMANDAIYWSRLLPRRRLARYLLHTVLLYGSMFFVSLRTSLASAFGGSTFLVTPKHDRRVSFREAVKANLGELCFGLGLALLATALTGSVLPVVLLVIPSLASVYLTVMHQDKNPEKFRVERSTLAPSEGDLRVEGGERTDGDSHVQPPSPPSHPRVLVAFPASFRRGRPCRPARSDCGRSSPPAVAGTRSPLS
jgi:cellulose synthase/poly-beta-1,6-N-acetylglucosamine synthase-like glycosyltransferase